jgi:hypothetical protein
MYSLHALVALILICLKDASVSESSAIIKKNHVIKKNSHQIQQCAHRNSNPLVFFIFCEFLLFLSGFEAA